MYNRATYKELNSERESDRERGKKNITEKKKQQKFLATRIEVSVQTFHIDSSICTDFPNCCVLLHFHNHSSENT